MSAAMKFARTLNEAFPNTVGNATWIERHRRTPRRTRLWLFVWAAFMVLGTSSLIGVMA